MKKREHFALPTEWSEERSRDLVTLIRKPVNTKYKDELSRNWTALVAVAVTLWMWTLFNVVPMPFFCFQQKEKQK